MAAIIARLARQQRERKERLKRELPSRKSNYELPEFPERFVVERDNKVTKCSFFFEANTDYIISVCDAKNSHNPKKYPSNSIQWTRGQRNSPWRIHSYHCAKCDFRCHHNFLLIRTGTHSNDRGICHLACITLINDVTHQNKSVTSSLLNKIFLDFLPNDIFIP